MVYTIDEEGSAEDERGIGFTLPQALLGCFRSYLVYG